VADGTHIEWTRGPNGEPGASWNPLGAFRKSDGKRGWHCEYTTRNDGTRDHLYDTGDRIVRPHLRDRKGGNMSEWDEDLRVRDYPTVRP
jgi:hypothetical protein